MDGTIEYNISELCIIVSAKTYEQTLNKNAKKEAALYVGAKYDMDKRLAYFTSTAQETGFYLLSNKKFDLLYIAFILNSYVGKLFLHNEGTDIYIKGNVIKRNLESIRIVNIPHSYRRACNILELIINRISTLNVDDKTIEIKDATISFLFDMRNYISLEIYMKPIFVSHQVSILEPWARFIYNNHIQFDLCSIDDTFTRFYKLIIDPENEVMDAMKKVRMFMWELVSMIKKETK